MVTKFLLDSGDPNEYKELAALAKEKNSELWGATTNPTLIAKSASWRIAHRKISQKEASDLQKEIVLEILDIVPGAVSAEVYADENTKSDEMIKQGEEIATWHKRVVVKLPTTIEGFKARTELRKHHIPINNTLVFSQQQIFAICLHEQLIQKLYGPISNLWPSFISPFVGRLDDQNEDGMSFIEHGMKIKKMFDVSLWILEASVRKVEHMKRGIDMRVDLLTSPLNVYQEWFSLSNEQKQMLDPALYAKNLTPLLYWNPPKELFEIDSVEKFMNSFESGKLNVHHELTDKGVIRFAKDWQSIRN